MFFFICVFFLGGGGAVISTQFIHGADTVQHSISTSDVTNAGAEKVKLGRFCYVWLDRHTGQPVSPSCQGQSFLSPPDSAPNICPKLACGQSYPNPWSRPTRGRGKQIPMTHRLMQADGRPTGTPHMFHRGNAKHPALSSTSEYSAHLGCRCTVSRKEARSCCTVLHACLDAHVYEWRCVSIFTQHTLFFFIERLCTRVSMYITKWAVAEAAFLWVEGEKVRGEDTISHWELDCV